MRSNLLVVERIVLESIGKGQKSSLAIAKDTGLHHGIILSVLQNLLMGQLITIKDSLVSINRAVWEKKRDEINSNENVKMEMRELFTALVNRYYRDESRTNLRFKKIYLDHDDEKSYEQILRSLDIFIDNVEKKQAQRLNPIETLSKRVVIFGESEYSGVVKEVIRAV